MNDAVDNAEPQAVTGIAIPATNKPSVLFDRNAEFTRSVPSPDVESGKKKCTVRFPTDEEWCALNKKKVQVRKSISGGRNTIDTPRAGRANAELFEAIRLDKGVAFDEAEATFIIDTLERCEITNVVQLGTEFTISMNVCGNKDVTHVLRMPSLKDIQDLGRAAVHITGGRQTTETKVALEPSGDLWRKKCTSHVGYSDASNASVPIPHMEAAINELIAQVNSFAEQETPED